MYSERKRKTVEEIIKSHVTHRGAQRIRLMTPPVNAISYKPQTLSYTIKYYKGTKILNSPNYSFTKLL